MCGTCRRQPASSHGMDMGIGFRWALKMSCDDHGNHDDNIDDDNDHSEDDGQEQYTWTMDYYQW